MSSPLPAEPISVRPAALEALAAELAALAAELAEDADLCRSAAQVLGTALGGDEGAAAGAGATAWAALGAVLADGTRALAGTLRAAAAGYVELDAALSGGIGSGAAAPGGR
jgi:Excreted virulence factor EspC, type VII ESX diderm